MRKENGEDTFPSIVKRKKSVGLKKEIRPEEKGNKQTNKVRAHAG